MMRWEAGRRIGAFLAGGDGISVVSDHYERCFGTLPVHTSVAMAMFRELEVG